MKPIIMDFNKQLHRPYHAYNIFFMLERERLIQEMKELGGTVDAKQHHQLSYDLAGYGFITLPDLPPRFQHVHMPKGWYAPGKNTKRKHVRTHGCKFSILLMLLLVR
jgi:hypothetical protein